MVSLVFASLNLVSSLKGGPTCCTLRALETKKTSKNFKAMRPPVDRVWSSARPTGLHTTQHVARTSGTEIQDWKALGSGGLLWFGGKAHLGPIAFKTEDRTKQNKDPFFGLDLLVSGTLKLPQHLSLGRGLDQFDLK